MKSKTDIAVIIDFDGTITDIDAVDGLLVQFAKDREWITAEQQWLAGKLSSDECMAQQLESVRLSSKNLTEYLKSIPVDPGFFALRERVVAENIPMTILSDGFDLFIKKIMRMAGIKGIPFQANRMVQKGSRLVPSFPYKADSCGRCGNCKGAYLKRERANVRHFVFIGDGMSDVCAVRNADTVFAKGKLAAYCKEHNIPHTVFKNLSEVASVLQERLAGLRSLAWQA